jgi:hypothetical protein
MEMMMADGGLELMKMVLDIDPMHFVEIDDLTGLETMAELKPGGAGVVVTEENKLEYVELLSEHYLCGAIRKELSQFLMGFHELVPENALKECGINEKDLALIITGVPVIDVADWRAHCEVETRTPGPEADALLERWWEVVQAMSPEEHAKLLQFATGLSRLPLGGFKQLEPPFKLSLNMQSPDAKLPTGTPASRRRRCAMNRACACACACPRNSPPLTLPTPRSSPAHTCFNTVDVPPYQSTEDCRRKVKFAILEGSGSFAFA